MLRIRILYITDTRSGLILNKMRFLYHIAALIVGVYLTVLPARAQSVLAQTPINEYVDCGGLFSSLDSLSLLTAHPLPFGDLNDIISIGIEEYEGIRRACVYVFNAKNNLILPRMSGERIGDLGLAQYKESNIIVYKRLVGSSNRIDAVEEVGLASSFKKTGRSQAAPVSLRFSTETESRTNADLYAEFGLDERGFYIIHYLSKADIPGTSVVYYPKKDVKKQGALLTFTCKQYELRDTLMIPRIEHLLQATRLSRERDYLPDSHTYSIHISDSGGEMQWRQMESDLLQYHYQEALTVIKRICGIADYRGYRFLIMGEGVDRLFKQTNLEQTITIKIVPDEELVDSVCIDTDITLQFAKDGIKIKSLW